MVVNAVCNWAAYWVLTTAAMMAGTWVVSKVDMMADATVVAMA